jgi:molybdopterin-containing oxidoreductase family membrane subunit
MFYPTYVDVLTFTGTIGVFFLMYLIFIRFLPMIAIAEIRSVLPEANPHAPPTVIHNGAESGSRHV